MSDRSIALKAATVAEGFVGTVESGGENRGAQVERFLASVGLGRGAPWCAAFVRHVFEKAAGFVNLSGAGNRTKRVLSDAPLLPAGFPDSGYTPDFANWARANNAWADVSQLRGGFYEPKRGDLVCFYFAGKGRIAHIGIVVGTFKGGVITVEGNTSAPVSPSDPFAIVGVDRDGDGVFRKRRTWASLGRLGGVVKIGF